MLYCDALLMACKKVNLVDASAQSLADSEVGMYGYALADAVARFNNDRKLNIGNSRVNVTAWNRDQWLGWYYPIIRDGSQNLDLLTNIGNDSLNYLLVTPGSMDLSELPQRLQAVVSMGGSGGEWRIMAETDYERTSENQRVVCYAMRQNYGILRTRMPGSVTAIFSRPIYYPWEVVDSQGVSALNVHCDIAPSHIPYFVNLVAYELGMNQKVEEWLLRKLDKAIQDQRTQLYSTNMADRVKNNITNRDLVMNAWLARSMR